MPRCDLIAVCDTVKNFAYFTYLFFSSTDLVRHPHGVASISEWHQHSEADVSSRWCQRDDGSGQTESEQRYADHMFSGGWQTTTPVCLRRLRSGYISLYTCSQWHQNALNLPEMSFYCCLSQSLTMANCRKTHLLIYGRRNEHLFIISDIINSELLISAIRIGDINNLNCWYQQFESMRAWIRDIANSAELVI